MKVLQTVLQTRPHTLRRTCISLRWTTSLAPTEKKYAKPAIDKERKGPFVKNLFIGKFDTDILSFPEVLSVRRLQELELKVAPINDIFKKDETSSREKLEESKTHGLFGLQVPQEYGGLNLNATEYARFSELLSLDLPAAISLTAHQSYGMKVLLTEGNQEQKQRYLPQLASGEWVAAFCLAEPQTPTDVLGIDTEAIQEGDKWYINGRKVLISSDGKADLITVIAKTQRKELNEAKIPTFTAFLVEKNYDGVSFDKITDIVGNRGVKISEVIFNNTPVPAQNVLGEIGSGFKFCADTLSSNRFSAGSFAAGILKKLLQNVAEHCVRQKQLGKSLKDFELIKKKVSDIAFSIYTLESLTYLTAGILDNYENPDVSVESAIVKVLSSEMLSECIIECQNILGSLEFFKSYAYDTVLRDSKVSMLLEGSNEVLRMFIALSGFQHAGKEMKDDVQKHRNPTMYPGYVFRKMFERKNYMKDSPKLTMGLDGYVHPSLKNAAQQLEYGVFRLQYVVEILLLRHGRSITEKEIELNRVTDIVMGLYAMTAVLARSSRSYCTGIQDSEYEVKLTLAVCYNLTEMLKRRASSILDSPVYSHDMYYNSMADKIFSYKGYFFDHPLSRNLS